MDHYGIAIALALLNFLTLRILLPIKIWLDRRRSPRDLPHHYESPD
jgi:hypothetical protein